MKIAALAPWHGGNRILAKSVGETLNGCAWVGVPFAGGMSELPHITARTVVVGDKHRHVINLARTLQHPHYGPKLIRELRRKVFHPEELATAQNVCRHLETGDDSAAASCYALALSYFVCCWMARSETTGTKSEFKAGLSVRWNAGGGDSVVRFRNAVEGLRDWRKALARCTFVCEDAFEFLDKCKDDPKTGIYCDPPWPDDGKNYVHGFIEAQQRQLAARLAMFTQARVVVRYGDHPLIREIYPEPRWRWIEQKSRTSANKAKGEAIIVNGVF